MSTEVRAHITGTVWKIEVKAGQHVKEDDALVILESMKMELPIDATDPGVIEEVRVQEGQAVNEGDVVLTMIED